jgi:PIN domain nuclease of toxin-antitoxin system
MARDAAVRLAARGPLAGLLHWPHRNPFDRIIAAAAMASSLLLISADPVFDSLGRFTGWRNRVW